MHIQWSCEHTASISPRALKGANPSDRFSGKRSKSCKCLEKGYLFKREPLVQKLETSTNLICMSHWKKNPHLQNVASPAAPTFKQLRSTKVVRRSVRNFCLETHVTMMSLKDHLGSSNNLQYLLGFWPCLMELQRLKLLTPASASLLHVSCIWFIP